MPDSHTTSNDTLQEAQALTNRYHNYRKKRLIQSEIRGMPLLAIMLGAVAVLIVGAVTGGLGALAVIGLIGVALIAGVVSNKINTKRAHDLHRYRTNYIHEMEALGYELSAPKPTLLSNIKNFFGIKRTFAYSSPLDVTSFVKKASPEGMTTDNMASNLASPSQIAPQTRVRPLSINEVAKNPKDNTSISSSTQTQDDTSSTGLKK